METNAKPYILEMHPEVLERCFLVADILDDEFGQPYTEYGLIGLATQQDPFYVMATPLLPGQKVSTAGVYQTGHDVLKLRREIETLSKRLGKTLVPITFIHRHPGICYISSIDEEFLTGVFVDQTSTIINLQERKILRAGELKCGCPNMKKLSKRSANDCLPSKSVQIEYSICFSLIVNRLREFSIYAAKKQWCPFCQNSLVTLEAAKLRTKPNHHISKRERINIKKSLMVEVEEKIKLEKSAINIAKQL